MTEVVSVSEEKTEQDSGSFEWKINSGERVTVNLYDPEINIPDSDLSMKTGLLKDDLLRAALSWVDATNRGYDGEYIVYSHSFDQDIGVNNCVKTDKNDEIIYAYRPHKKGKRKKEKPTRFVLAREGESTNKVTVILQRQRSNLHEMALIAAWVGPSARPEPLGKHDKEVNRRFWSKHALALRDLNQIDTNQPLYQSDRGFEMSVKDLQDLFEDKEREFAVAKTIEHMRTSDFKDRLIRTETLKQQRQLKQIHIDALHRAIKLAKKSVEELVAEERGISINQGRQQDGWLKQVREKGRQKLGEEVNAKTITEEFADIHLQQIMLEKKYIEVYNNAEAELSRMKEKIEKKVDALLLEMELRKDEPDFIAAASLWTNAPDSRYDDVKTPNSQRGSLGINGRGYSGGLIHFFEYRSSQKKKDRFKTIEEPMTVDGFISFSNRIKEEMVDSEELFENSSKLTDNFVIVLEDARGNRRFYILKPNKDLILAYKKPGQALKISTLMVKSSIEYLERVVRLSIAGMDRGRINILGPKVECIGYKTPKDLVML